MLIARTAYATTQPSVTAAGSDTVVTTTHNINLSTTGGQETPIITVTFPTASTPEHYVIAAQGDLVNFGPSDYTRCELVVGTSTIANVSTIVGSPTAKGSMGPAGYLSPFALTGGATVPASGGTAMLECDHDNTDGATPYVDSDASVWAHNAASLTTGTE